MRSEGNDKPDQGYENTVVGAGIGTSFEQYKDLRTSLGTSFTYDDLRTDDTATASLKNKAGNLQSLQPIMVFLMIREIDHLCQRVDTFQVFHKLSIIRR